MAFINCFNCVECGNEVEESSPSGSGLLIKCSACILKGQEIARNLHLAQLEQLSLSERISRIERWIYDYKPPVNISDAKF